MKFKPLFILSALFLTLSFANKITAQVNNSESDSTKNHTFYVYFINGYAVSYDFYRDKKSSVRVYLDFSTSLNDINNDVEQTSTGSGYSNKRSYNQKNKNNMLSVTLSSYYVYSFYNSDLGEAYVGAGPLFGYTKYTYTGSNTPGDTLQYSYSSDSQNKSYSVGITLLIGIRGYITKHISLFAESHLSGGREWAKNERTDNLKGPNNSFSNNTSNSSGSGWFYNSQFIRSGISVTF